MKKKFITGLLLMAVTATGFSTFTSCKDTDDDLRTELQGEQANLQKALADLKAQIESIKSCACDPNSLITEAQVNQWITDKTKDLAKQSALDALKDALDNNKVTSLTAEEVTNLIRIAGLADNLLDDKTGLKELQAAVFGDDNNKGLVNTVAGLSEWFNGLNITPAQFQEYVMQGELVANHKAAIELLSEDAIKSLNANYKGVEEMYTKLFPNGTEGIEWWNYAEIINAIKDNEEAIDIMLGRINDMVTSLLLQATANPVFGSVNTPFGVNSMVLMSYYGKLSTGITKFPANGVSAEYNGKDVDVDWNAIANGKFYEIQNENLISLNDEGKASLGTLWFTVNPGTVENLNLNGFALVNSAEQESKVSLSNIAKDDETTFKFGITSRSAGNGNGLYSATATVAPEDLDAIKININSGLKDALVSAVKNHTATDIAKMLKAIYDQLQDVCDANAIRYTWNSKDKDETGAWIERENKVYSNYGVAATAFKPLSFSTLYGESFRQLPSIDPIELDKSLVDLNLKPFKVGDVSLNINIKIESIKIDKVGKTVIDVKVPAKFDVKVTDNGDGTASGAATLPEGWENMEGYYSTATVDITGNLQEVVDKIQASIDTWILGDETHTGLNEQINNAIKVAVDEAFNGPNGLITNIEGQVNDMMGSIQDKLYSLVDKINNDYLGKVNSLLNRVNNVSARINKILADPNHYLQATMLYENAAGQLGLLSTNPSQPTQFKGNGEAIELWATTFNYETLCPAFKKFIGVTKVTKNGTEDCPALVAAANNSANLMATVLDGNYKRVALDVKGATAGVYTYEIAYQALDYTGHTSTVKCYLQVVRN